MTPDLLRLLVESQGRRVTSAELDGRRVWVKRYAAERRPLGKWLHGKAAPLLRSRPFLLSSPLRDEAGMAERERRKLAAFRAAGFAVPDIVFSNDRALVTADVAETLERRLATLRGDAHAHDGLLLRLSETLGAVHAAGLCHGRPHPRDSFLRGDAVGFLDMEEEPEAAMPLTHAQARDAWLLFCQIVPSARLAETPGRAFAAYAAKAPAGTLDALRRLVGFASRFAPLMNLAARIHDGGDLRRLRASTNFLGGVLAARPETLETSP